MFKRFRSNLAKLIYPELDKIEDELSYVQKQCSLYSNHITDIQEQFQITDKVFAETKNAKLRQEARQALSDLVFRYRFILARQISANAIRASHIAANYAKNKIGST